MFAIIFIIILTALSDFTNSSLDLLRLVVRSHLMLPQKTKPNYPVPRLSPGRILMVEQMEQTITKPTPQSTSLTGFPLSPRELSPSVPKDRLERKLPQLGRKSASCPDVSSCHIQETKVRTSYLHILPGGDKTDLQVNLSYLVRIDL